MNIRKLKIRLNDWLNRFGYLDLAKDFEYFWKEQQQSQE